MFLKLGIFFFSILFLFLFPCTEIPAQNCSSPPTGSYGPAWAREYEAWCRGCCGIFSMSGGNPSCSPTSNWGCKGSGSPHFGSPMGSALYQSGYQLGLGLGKLLFGDPQEEARRRAQAEWARQQNQQTMESLDRISRERVKSEDAMLRQMEEESRRLDEQSRKEALSALKGLPQGKELPLKPATDFFGIAGNPQSERSPLTESSVVDLRHLDPNKPITVDPHALQAHHGKSPTPIGAPKIDCEKAKATRDRLAAGLPVQLAAMKRTEAQLEAARKAVEASIAEKREILLQAAVQEAKGYAKSVLTSAAALRSQIEMLKGLDLNRAERDLLIRSIETLIFEGENLAQAAQAGYEGGEELRNRVDKLSQQMLNLADKLLMQSGIAEAVGEEFAGKMWGPLGELGFRGARLSIDFSAAIGKGLINEAEREAAQKHLDIMRGQYEEVKKRISEIDQDLAQGCKDSVQARP